MNPSKQRIFDVIKKNTLQVLIDLNPEEVTIDTSLTELGANSVDRVEVVMYSIEDLDIEVPRTELHGIQDIRSLVDLLHSHSEGEKS